MSLMFMQEIKRGHKTKSYYQSASHREHNREGMLDRGTSKLRLGDLRRSLEGNTLRKRKGLAIT